MDDQANQPEPKKVPALAVGWNPEDQSVFLKFDAKEFKNWGFVKSLLQMALWQAEHMEKQTMLKEMRERARDAALTQQIMQG